jgi:hypothetical protein
MFAKETVKSGNRNKKEENINITNGKFRMKDDYVALLKIHMWMDMCVIK